MTLRVAAVLLACVAVLPVQPRAQRRVPGDVFPSLVRANERFGRTLLRQMHTSAPTGNTVVAPLSVTLLAGAFAFTTSAEPLRRQFEAVFGWNWAPHQVAVKMLRQAFAVPAPTRYFDGARLAGEGVWLSNQLAYRDSGVLPADFLTTVRDGFGFETSAVGGRRPSAADIGADGRPSLAPRLDGANDVAVRSGVYVRTTWAGNTFSTGNPRQGTFTNAAGVQAPVTVVESEAATYRYAKTDVFEAVALQAWHAYIVFALPSPGTTMASLLDAIVMSPTAIDADLAPRGGTVTMPPFRLRVENDLRPPLEALGVRAPFQNLAIRGARQPVILRELRQGIDLRVDRIGIRADAETVGGGIYGGLEGASEPFRMVLDRPFVFFIRDEISNSLLFAGVVNEVVAPTRD